MCPEGEATGILDIIVTEYICFQNSEIMQVELRDINGSDTIWVCGGKLEDKKICFYVKVFKLYAVGNEKL